MNYGSTKQNNWSCFYIGLLFINGIDTWYSSGTWIGYIQIYTTLPILHYPSRHIINSPAMKVTQTPIQLSYLFMASDEVVWFYDTNHPVHATWPSVMDCGYKTKRRFWSTYFPINTIIMIIIGITIFMRFCVMDNDHGAHMLIHSCALYGTDISNDIL